MKIYLPLTPSFSILAGEYYQDGEKMMVEPPSVSMFDQVLTWLLALPKPPYAGVNADKLGIGATALAVRYGTWLGVLMNEMSLLDYPPRDELAPLVGITQQEMMRINIEASANVARLLEVWNEGQPMDYLDLLLKAYAYLPMPMRHVKRNNRAAMDVALALRYEEIADKSGVDLGLPKLLQQVDLTLRTTIKNAPYRALANYYINASYRNGPVEDVHGGNYRRLHLWERYFTNKEIKATLRFTSEQLAGVFTLAPWHLNWREKIEMVLLAGLYTPDGVSAHATYPQTWSLTLHTTRMEVSTCQPSFAS